MKIIQSRSFARHVKKFGKQEKKVLDEQVLKIVENPSLGNDPITPGEILLEEFLKLMMIKPWAANSIQSDAHIRNSHQ
jgi:hypothetical protein